MASSKSNHQRSLCGVTHEGSPNFYPFLFRITDPYLQRTVLPHEKRAWHSKTSTCSRRGATPIPPVSAPPSRLPHHGRKATTPYCIWTPRIACSPLRVSARACPCFSGSGGLGGRAAQARPLLTPSPSTLTRGNTGKSSICR
ncbi:unnamed protein product [Ectocarpus sp. 6 AP-2014]